MVYTSLNYSVREKDTSKIKDILSAFMLITLTHGNSGTQPTTIKSDLSILGKLVLLLGKHLNKYHFYETTFFRHTCLKHLGMIMKMSFFYN